MDFFFHYLQKTIIWNRRNKILKKEREKVVRNSNCSEGDRGDEGNESKSLIQNALPLDSQIGHFECSETSQHRSDTPVNWVITQSSCKSVGMNLPTQLTLVHPLAMQMIKFELKYSHKRKGMQGMRGGNISCINVSEKTLLLQLPLKPGQ